MDSAVSFLKKYARRGRLDVISKGVVLYNGVGGTPAAGGIAYAAANGVISAVNSGKVVGKFLGVKDADGNVLVKIEL